MLHLCRAGGFILTLTLAGISIQACQSEPAVAPQVRRPAPPPSDTELRGRLAEAPDADLLASARERMAGGGRRESCGPYPLYTDIENAQMIDACSRVAERLDGVYEARYGLRPRGRPAAAIVLFGDAEDYRDFAREGGVPVGYAGYALAARGLVIFHTSSSTSLDSFLQTLAHELTHLVNRRALGVNLPPWLAEGLSDGIGDTATPAGFDPIDGIVGLEPLAKRLQQAFNNNQAGDLQRLVTLRRGEFDSGVVSHDYEQSALFVRFLFSEPGLASGLRKFLKDFATGEPYDPGRLAADLGSDWADLDRRFRRWLEDSL